VDELPSIQNGTGGWFTQAFMGHWWVLVHCGRNMFCSILKDLMEHQTPPVHQIGEGHEYHNHGSTLIPSMLYDEITMVFRFTSGIFQTLLLNLNFLPLIYNLNSAN
jgi:hypothetical protein